MRALAIDVGASKIEFATKEQLRAGRIGRMEINKTINHTQLVFIIKELIYEERAQRVGLALPGMVRGGRVISLPNLPEVDGKKFSGLLKKLPAKIFVENDVKCMARAHLAARGWKKDDDFLLIAPGSGIGGAIVREGRLVSGAHNTAGEVGHMKIRDSKGRWAEWEDVCAGVGLEKKWKMKKKTRMSAKEIFKLAGRDKFARVIVHEGARAFGAGLANIANIVDPEEIIIAGSVGREYMKEPRLRKIAMASYRAQGIEPVRRTEINLSKIHYPALVGALEMAEY